MGWFKNFIDGIFDFFERLGSKRTRESITGVIRLILLAAEAYQRFNRKLTGPEKREAVRMLVYLAKYATEQEIREMMNIILDMKRTGEIEQVESWEIDKMIGDGISLFVKAKHDRRAAMNKGDPGA